MPTLRFRFCLPAQRVITAVAPLVVWLTSNQVEARLMPLMPPQPELVEAAPVLSAGFSQPNAPPARPQRPTNPSPGQAAELRETTQETVRRERAQKKIPRALPKLTSAFHMRNSTLLAFASGGSGAQDPGPWQPSASWPTSEPGPATVASEPVDTDAPPSTEAPPARTPAAPGGTPTTSDATPAPAAAPANSGAAHAKATAPEVALPPPPPPYSQPSPTAATRATDPSMACPFGLCTGKKKRRRAWELPRLRVKVGRGTLSMNLYADLGYTFGPQRKHRYHDYITKQVVEDFGRRDFTSYPLYVNQFSLAYGFIQGQYELPEKFRVRFSMHAGHIVESLYFEEMKSLQLIREASFQYWFIPQLAVEAGILPSYYGAEIVLNKENLHATRAYIADFTPDYEAGVRLHIYPRKDMAIRLQVLNGWQEIRDANGRKGYGLVWSIIRPGQIVGDWCIYWGNEAPRGQEPVLRHYHDIYYRIWLGKRWLIFPMFDMVMQKNNVTDRFDFVVSPAMSLRYGITDRVGVALRYDYLYNKADIVPELKTNTPNGWQTHSGTATLEYLPLPQLTLRLEGRYGTNKDAVFRNAYNVLVREDWYVTLSAAFHI